jgi:hypothetical protein
MANPCSEAGFTIQVATWMVNCAPDVQFAIRVVSDPTSFAR